jgi:hypothetical protein
MVAIPKGVRGDEERRQPILLSRRAFCLCREIAIGVSVRVFEFAFPGADD